MEETAPDLYIAAPNFGLYERLGSMAGILVGALIIYIVLFFFLKRWARKKEHRMARLLQQNLYYQGLAVIAAVTVTAVPKPPWKYALP